MVRALLVVALCTLVGCDSQPRSEARTPVATQTSAQTDSNSHKDLACASCHKGVKVGSGRASVPREACTAAGCHEDAGPPEVELATARFEHRNHATSGDVVLNCAGCHTHDQGKAPLHASVDACALCHTSDFVGTRADDCQLCHDRPRHVAFSSQGIPIAHGALPSFETGCARCHYNVAAPPTKVTVEKCAACHDRSPDVTKRAIATDLHPTHRGVTCTSCHQSDMHRIGAMSSAVELQCADCHDSAHEQRVTSATLTQACVGCHRDTHSAQQRLVLGFVGQEAVVPSAKFLMGLTCRSCHAPPGGPQTEPRRGQAIACSACHDQEFERVLDWWIEGSHKRERAATAYVTSARNALRAAPDSARALLTGADSMLALVRNAGGQHNIELSDIVFRTSVANAAAAYKLAGRTAPPAPTFGNTPHVGNCSFCHYAGTQSFSSQAALPGLHERLLRNRK